ncbi:hypothetical protein KSB_66990 [Ktedonobacter robiniae]|uniref:TraD/TraG TraM recognition site domain-containing protein n=2 Tax=Ktedonobacter robiniae TaxID=2778365 RepID=A0ABQ3UZZ2_9CHLR|nr:hypothetical protein KSB_66990 [Ktedonobacter robiniae]
MLAGRPASGGDLPAAGRLIDFAQHLAMLRSRRVALIYAVQNFAQLDDIYGRARRPTIVTNANTHIVLPGTGQEEAVNCFIQYRKTFTII